MYGTMPVAQPKIALQSGCSLEYLGLTLENYEEPLRSWFNPEAKQGTVFQATVSANHSSTINFKDSQSLLAAFTMIRAGHDYVFGNATWPNGGATATECGLNLCLNVYLSNVTKGTLNESIVATTSSKVPNSWQRRPESEQLVLQLRNSTTAADPETLEHNPIYHPIFRYRDDYQLDPVPLNRSKILGPFNVTQRAILSTIDFLTSLVQNGSVQVIANPDVTGDLHVYESPILQPLYTSNDTSATFDFVAKSLSNAIRSVGTSPVQGETQRWVVHYNVRWAFLTLPLSLITSESHAMAWDRQLLLTSLIAVGAAFLVLSIAESHRAHVPVWKSNSIATMIHGPDELLRRDLRAVNHNESLGVASETIAALEDLLDGLALTVPHLQHVEISRPRTPSRDEEEIEMSALKLPATPQTPGSMTTLIEPQAIVGEEQGMMRPVSPTNSEYE